MRQEARISLVSLVFFSKGGRVTLSELEVSGISLCYLFHFKMSISVSKDIERFMRGRGSLNEVGGFFKAFGEWGLGLGFSNLQLHNEALLAK